MELDQVARVKVIGVRSARAALRRQEPQFIESVVASLIRYNDIDRADRESAPLLGDRFKRWPEALTAIFDLELAMHKLKETDTRLRDAVADAPSAGKEFAYHVDVWLFRASALLERCETALTRLLKLAIRRGDLEPFLSTFKADIRQAKDVIKAYRDPLAHGEGGGVDGITPNWAGLLAIPNEEAATGAFNATIIDGVPDSIDLETRQRWFYGLNQTYTMILIKVQECSGAVADEIEKQAETRRLNKD